VTSPNRSARGARRLSRTSLLVGIAVLAVSAGGGVAAAQTPLTETTTPDTTTSTTTGDAGTAPDATAPTSDTAGGTQDAAGTPTEERTGARLVRENVRPRKIFAGGRRRAKFNFETAGGTVDAVIKATKRGSGKVVQTWHRDNVQPGTIETVRWNGRKSGGGKAKGRYFFAVKTAGGSKLSRKRADGKREVRVYPAKFPVRGRHQYWDGFGAGRGHQGQDVGASCGTTLVAAQAGTVAYKGYDGGGYGNYLIINVAGEPHAEVYGHLKRSASVRQGSNVKTGEKIGEVGATGNASGCHLHFEYWEGKYPGGNARPSVTKRLKEWDSWS
jgi:murein DD-endopeptidase MepM/ murein hydrolase activator NlpD